MQLMHHRVSAILVSKFLRWYKMWVGLWGRASVTKFVQDVILTQQIASHPALCISPVFTARALLSWYMLWSYVCLSVSVTSRCSTKMAKHRNTQTVPHDSAGTLDFWCQRSLWNSINEVNPTVGEFRQITRHISKKVQDRCTAYIKDNRKLLCSIK